MAGEDVDIPKVGPLPKKVLIPLAVGLAGYVGWRYWQARKGTGADAGTVADGEFGAVDSSIPGVLGAVSPTNSYGSGGDTGNTNDGNDPTRFTSNAQWTAYVRTQLDSAYDDTDIVAALGNWLGSQPLSSSQQTIVRAAIAVAGNPPVGGPYPLVPGGNTAIIVAPGNVHVQSVTSTTAVIAFNPVAGATRYTVYRSGGSSVGIGTTSPVTITGLSPNTTYSMNVAATTAAGTDGPHSGNVTVKTPATALKAPTAPTLVKAIGDALVVKTGSVSGATGYRWYLNGHPSAVSQATQVTIAPLHRKTKYSVSVRAMISGQPDGPMSASRSFSTK